MSKDYLILFLDTKSKRLEPEEMVKKIHEDLLNCLYLLSMWWQYTKIVYMDTDKLQEVIEEKEKNEENEENVENKEKEEKEEERVESVERVEKEPNVGEDDSTSTLDGESNYLKILNFLVWRIKREIKKRKRRNIEGREGEVDMERGQDDDSDDIDEHEARAQMAGEIEGSEDEELDDLEDQEKKGTKSKEEAKVEKPKLPLQYDKDLLKRKDAKDTIPQKEKEKHKLNDYDVHAYLEQYTKKGFILNPEEAEQFTKLAQAHNSIVK